MENSKPSTTAQSSRDRNSHLSTSIASNNKLSRTDAKFTTRSTELKPVLVAKNTPGNGLWSYVKADTAESQNFLPSLKEGRALNMKLEHKIENEVIVMLEERLREQGQEVESAKAELKQANIENTRLRAMIGKLEYKIREQDNELLEERVIKKDLDAQLDDLRENYNSSRREVGRLEQELKNSKENILKMTTSYHEAAARLERERKEFDGRVQNFKGKLDEMEDENEELKAAMQRKTAQGSLSENEFQVYVKELQAKHQNDLKGKVQKITKLVAENSQLQQRIEENEIVRRRMFERHAQDENQIKQLMDSCRELERTIYSLKSESKTLAASKSNNHKVYEEKIKTLINENNLLTTEISRMKKKHNMSREKQVLQQTENDEELEPVEPKPHLFGSVDLGRY